MPPPSQGVPTAPPLPLGGSWPSHVRGLIFWVLAGIGESGEQPPAPLLCVVCLFFLGPCLSAHLPLPDLRRCPCLDLPTPKGLALGSPGLDVVYGSVVTVPLQNKDCSGLPGPLPPAAWGLGRAGGWGLGGTGLGDRGVVKAGRSPGEPGKPSQRIWHSIWSVFTGWQSGLSSLGGEGG